MLLRPLLTMIALMLAPCARGAEIPLNVGVGPTAFLIPERLGPEQRPILGLALDIAGVLDKATIARHKSMIPARYRQAASRVEEARIGSLWVPERLMISPRPDDDGPSAFGATWKPVSLSSGLSLGPTRLNLSLGLVLTYLYIDTGTFRIQDEHRVTNFLRPGAEAQIEYVIRFSERILTSLGAGSALYVPQAIGGGVGQIGDRRDRSIWRIHQAFVLLHVRVPMDVRL